jgi:hypothetical protein
VYREGPRSLENLGFQRVIKTRFSNEKRYSAMRAGTLQYRLSSGSGVGRGGVDPPVTAHPAAHHGWAAGEKFGLFRAEIAIFLYTL